MPRKWSGSAYIDCTGAQAGYAQNKGFAWCVWMNSGTSGSVPYLLTLNNSGDNTPKLSLRQDDIDFNRWTVNLQDDGGTNQFTHRNGSGVFNSTWIHLLYTQDGAGNYFMYTAGLLDFQGTYTPTAGTMTLDRMTIGAFRGAATGNYCVGSLAHVGMWNRHIAPGEALALARGALPSRFSPLHYWPLIGDSIERDVGMGRKIPGRPTLTIPTGDLIPKQGIWRPSLWVDQMGPLLRGVGPTSAIKTVEGLARASVKTVEGLALGSVKTIEGLA